MFTQRFDTSLTEQVSLQEQLFEAAVLGDISVAAAMLSAGVSVNAVCSEGISSLHRASRLGQAAMAEYLLENGANVNATSESGDTPFLSAAASSNADTIRVISRAGGKVDVVNSDGDTPLHRLAWFCDDHEADETDEALTALLECEKLDLTALNNAGDSAVDNAKTNEAFGLAERIEQEVSDARE